MDVETNNWRIISVARVRNEEDETKDLRELSRVVDFRRVFTGNDLSLILNLG